MLAIATYVLAALILEIWSIDPSASIVINYYEAYLDRISVAWGTRLYIGLD